MIGQLITLEGVDGAGKSSHTDWLLDRLKSQGLNVLSTREPGGTELGEKLRHLLLTEPMTLDTETLLMFAARMEHVQQVIKPALAQGTWVVCDRFTDATYAYQGGGRQLDLRRIQTLEAWVHQDLQPNHTLFFDVPLNVARERLLKTRSLDRFENEDIAFFERTQQAYYERVQQYPERFVSIDGTQSIEAIRAYLTPIIHAWVRS